MKRLVIGLAAVCLAFGVASAQYSQNFDGLNGSAQGVILTGQDGYYLPNGPSSDVDFKVYTYSGNVLGFPQNPDGGSKFIAGTGPGGGLYARAQRDADFGIGYGIWEIVYDHTARYDGAAPASDNVGSFSSRQNPATTDHINLFTWVDINNPTLIRSNYVVYDANGVQAPVPGVLPGPEWDNLPVNHWYRSRIVLDLDQNMIIQVGIRDLSGGPEAVFNPTGWYLAGGANQPTPPDNFRFFGGGGNAGNTTAWDNIDIHEVATATGACCFADGTCQILTGTDCAGAGGTYQGDGTACEPNPCPQPPNPVEVHTWGSIKHGFDH